MHIFRLERALHSFFVQFQIEVMCNGEIMGKDHTLEFVYMTRWRIKVTKTFLRILELESSVDLIFDLGFFLK